LEIFLLWTEKSRWSIHSRDDLYHTNTTYSWQLHCILLANWIPNYPNIPCPCGISKDASHNISYPG
jgi:hypothetical protein